MHARRVPAAVLLTLLALLAAPAVADVVRANIGGEAHEFDVPAGWSTRQTPGGLEFLPPKGRVKRLSVSVVGIDKPSGTDDAASILRAFIEGERREKRYLDAGKVEPVEFVGVTGTMVVLSGAAPGGELEAEMFVVSVANGNVYLFSCMGAHADITVVVDDLADIIGGVRLAGGKGGGGSGKTGDNLEEALGHGGKDARGAIGNGAGKGGVAVKAEEWLLVDDAFGLKLKAPVLRRWRLAIADEEYQLERTDEQPHAVVAIRRVPVKNQKTYVKQAEKDGRSKQTKFAGAPALLVERKVGETIERRYHLLGEASALVFEFRVVGRSGDAGVDARVYEVEQAVVIDDKGVSSWSDGATDLTTYAGVRLSTAPVWALGEVGPGRANFKNDRAVEVEVRVRPWPKTSDPFASADEELSSMCGKDAYTKAEVAVLGAKAAMRYRCVTKKQALVVLVVEGRAQDGARIFVRVTARNGKGKKQAKAADAEIAEFGAYLTLPH